MKRAVRLALTVLAVTSTPLFAAAPAAPQLTVTISTAAVRVEGVTPRGQAELLIVWHGRENYRDVLGRRTELLTDDDGDGVVTFALTAPLPALTIAAAIDTTDGRFGIGTPGFRPESLSASHAELQNDNSGHAAALQAVITDAEAIVVRPGRGSWSLSIGEGGPFDGDGRMDQHLTLRFSLMKGRGNAGPAPDHLLPSDVLIVVDPMTMRVFAGRINS